MDTLWYDSFLTKSYLSASLSRSPTTLAPGDKMKYMGVVVVESKKDSSRIYINNNDEQGRKFRHVSPSVHKTTQKVDPMILLRCANYPASGVVDERGLFADIPHLCLPRNESRAESFAAVQVIAYLPGKS